MENFYVPITLVSTPVWILSSWVQLSESTSARDRNEEFFSLTFCSKMDLRRRREMYRR